MRSMYALSSPSCSSLSFEEGSPAASSAVVCVMRAIFYLRFLSKCWLTACCMESIRFLSLEFQ